MHTQMKKIAIFGEGILQKTVHFVESCLFHGSHRSCEDNLCATCIFSMLPVDQKMMFYWDMHWINAVSDQWQYWSIFVQKYADKYSAKL